MALVLADRVRETTTTTGTGTVTLAGAVTGFQSFAAVGNANTTYYTIAGQGTAEWEVGIGTYTSVGTTLARTTVLASSNAGSLVVFSAGTKDVFVTYPAGRSIYADGTTLTATNSSVLPATSGGTGVTTAQAEMNRVAGAVTSGSYLRGNGTNVVMSTIQAADVPTLNQNTTGTAANVTGIVAAANGGTGQSSYAVGDLVYASTTTALSKLADVATGNAIISGGVGVAPSYGKIGLTTHISGTLAVGNGGTGVTTSTGSGAVVLGTSPTLTTPTINSAQVATVSGTAALYFCRAWVNFNGTGTVAIRGSGNVSSITDSATGKYLVNFSTAMTDVNYASSGNGQKNDTGDDGGWIVQTGGYVGLDQTASALPVRTRPATVNTPQDGPWNFVAVFR